MFDQTLSDIREIQDSDGFYGDGLEVLAIIIRLILSRNDIFDYEISLPGGLGVCVDFCGGVPSYLIKTDCYVDNFEETTRSGAVAFLEGTSA